MLHGINTYSHFIEQLFDMVTFNEREGKNIHECSVLLALQHKNYISIVINAKPLIKTENNGRVLNNFNEKVATVASAICR